jgi:hypothetical protein
MGGHSLCHGLKSRVWRDTGSAWQADGMTRYLPLLLLAACASPGAGEYHRGTPPAVRPMAPPARAPRYAPPGTTPAQAQPLPPSPHKRALPPSREPGLWSGAQPKAALVHLPPTFLGVRFAFPPAADTEEERAPTRKCGIVLQAVVKPEAVERWLKPMSEAERKCAILSAHMNCLDAMLTLLNNAAVTTGSALDQSAWKRIEAALDTSSKEASRACRPVGYSEPVERFLERIAIDTLTTLSWGVE